MIHKQDNIFIFRAVNIFIALFIISFNIILPKILSDVHNKYIWVDQEIMVDSSKIDSVVLFAYNNNINKIFMQVRGAGDASYESQIVPKYEKLDSLFDPLNYILLKTKHSNIEIHAWFNVYLLWKNSQPPINNNHLYYACGECLATDINRKNDKDIKLNQNHSYNWEGIYLSPLHPTVNEHLLLVIDELLKTYDVDGLHLDYVRFQDIFYGYNKEGIALFKNKFNFNPKDIDRGIFSQRFGYNESSADSLKSIWQNYKLNSVTEFIRSVKYLLMNDAIDIDLSVAVKPHFINAKYRYYQDWYSWLQEGIIDYVVVKNHTPDIQNFILNNKLILDHLSNEDIYKIVIDLLVENENLDLIKDKIILSRLEGFSNFSINKYNFTKDTTNWYNPIIQLLNLE